MTNLDQIHLRRRGDRLDFLCERVGVKAAKERKKNTSLRTPRCISVASAVQPLHCIRWTHT